MNSKPWTNTQKGGACVSRPKIVAQPKRSDIQQEKRADNAGTKREQPEVGSRPE